MDYVKMDVSQETLSCLALGTTSLCGLNILSLESNLDSNQANNTYSIHIEGTLSERINPLYEVLEHLLDEKNSVPAYFYKFPRNISSAPQFANYFLGRL
jgi:hypothetical protein